MPPAESDNRKKAGQRTGRSTISASTKVLRHKAEGYFLVVAWLLVTVFFCVMEPHSFFTLRNFETMFSSEAVLLLVSLAMLPPLVAGDLDFSPAGVLGLSMVLVGVWNVEWRWPILATIGLTLLIAIAIGVINSIVIVGIGVNSIITTFGVITFLAGVTTAALSGPVSGVSASFVNVMTYRLFGLQSSFYIALALCIVMWFVLSKMPLGRRLYFTGAGRDVARLAGIATDRYRVVALVSSAVIGALAGIVLTGLIGSADPTIGSTYLLPALAALFLGQTAITPRRANVWGTFVAVYFLSFGITGLQFKGFAGWISQVFYGLALVIAVSISTLLGRSAQAA